MNVQVKSDINARNLVVWPISNESSENCGTAVAFGERLKNISDSLQTNTQSASADGVVVETYTGIGTGTLGLGLTELTPSERTLLFAQAVQNTNVVIVTGKEKIPCVRVAFMTDTSDGKVNLYKYFRVKFAPYEKTVRQISESGQATFSSITINGTYFQSQSENVTGLKAEAKNIDPLTTEGQTFITNWFTNADYIGGTVSGTGNGD